MQPQAVPGPPSPYRPAVPGPPKAPAVTHGGTETPGADTVHPGVDGSGAGHPAVDAVLQGMANAAGLPPADQIAQYEAAHRTLQETLASIDQA